MLELSFRLPPLYMIFIIVFDYINPGLLKAKVPRIFD